MVSLNVTELRKNVAEYIGRVLYAGERIAIHKNGKPACAIVSMEDLKILEALEDHIDIRAAESAMKENDSVGWDELKKQLDL